MQGIFVKNTSSSWRRCTDTKKLWRRCTIFITYLTMFYEMDPLKKPLLSGLKFFSNYNLPLFIRETISLRRIAERRNNGFHAVQSVTAECGIPRGKFRKESPPTSLWHRNMFLSTKPPNCYILIHSKPAILTHCSHETVRFRYFLDKVDFFISPMRSSLLFIYLCHSLGQEVEGHPPVIMCKCISFNHDGKNVIFPLVHTFITWSSVQSPCNYTPISTYTDSITPCSQHSFSLRACCISV